MRQFKSAIASVVLVLAAASATAAPNSKAVVDDVAQNAYKAMYDAQESKLNKLLDVAFQEAYPQTKASTFAYNIPKADPMILVNKGTVEQMEVISSML